jgi:hypothetical protein
MLCRDAIRGTPDRFVHAPTLLAWQFPIANALSCHPRPFSVCRLQAPGKNRRIPPLPLRPATAEEPVPYLQTPTFSSCTVPVLLYSSWRGNFFHIFKGGCPVAVIHSLFRVSLL